MFSLCSGLIGLGRILGSSSCSWKNIIIGTRHPPCFSSLTSPAQPSWRMPIPRMKPRAPVVAVGNAVLVLQQERHVDLALEQRPGDVVPVAHHQSQNLDRKSVV